MAFEARYPHARFVGPLAENLVALVGANIADALSQIAAEDGEAEPLEPFAVVANSPWARTTQVFPAFWLDDEDTTPLREDEDAAGLNETHRFQFWVAVKRVIAGTPTEAAKATAASRLRKDARVYVRAVTQILLSMNPREDLITGVNTQKTDVPVMTDLRQRVFGPTGGDNEFLAYGMVEAAFTMFEGK